MQPVRVAATLTLVVATAQACFHESTDGAGLRAGVASVCHGAPLLVSARRDGHYSLNARLLNSAGLVSTLGYILSPRPEKIVMVDVDSTRKSSARWIAAAIGANGGLAYLPDSACLKQSALATLR